MALSNGAIKGISIGVVALLIGGALFMSTNNEDARRFERLDRGESFSSTSSDNSTGGTRKKRSTRNKSKKYK